MNRARAGILSSLALMTLVACSSGSSATHALFANLDQKNRIAWNPAPGTSTQGELSVTAHFEPQSMQIPIEVGMRARKGALPSALQPTFSARFRSKQPVDWQVENPIL